MVAARASGFVGGSGAFGDDGRPWHVWAHPSPGDRRRACSGPGCGLMLQERRQLAHILDEQGTLAQQFVNAANARYSAGTGAQADVLRAETTPRSGTTCPR